MPIAKTTTGVLRLATLAQDDGGLECSGSEYISRSFALLRISPAGSRCAHARKAAQLRMTARTNKGRSRFLGSASLTRCNARNDADWGGVQRKLFGGVRRAEICGILRAPTHSIEASSIEREAAAQDDEFIKWGLRRNICGGTG